MDSTVVVTGATEHVAAVSAALRQAGAEVTAVDDPGQLAAVVAGMPPGSLDCYVQLPVHVAARGGTVTERVRHFLEDGLLARFAAASTILPAMSDEGRVVLVAGSSLVHAAAPDDPGAPDDDGAPDDPRARLAFLDVLAHAIQADKAATRIGVRVLPRDVLAEDVVAAAMGREPTRELNMSLDDWRIEVMGLVNGRF